MDVGFQKKVVINQIVRVILDSLIIYGINVPLFIKILFLYLTDFLDIILPFYIDMDSFENGFDEYQKIDKVGDIYVYTILWIYFVRFVDSPIPLKIYITLLFFWRWIGLLIYLEKNDRKIFCIFPNVFLESLLAISFLQFIGYSYMKNFKLYVVVLSLVLILKIIQEIYIHTNLLNVLKN